MTSIGTLYGVGIGPGDPELLTLKAVKILKAVDVIAAPRGSDWGHSVAWGIAEPSVGEVEGQERLFLTFPMSKDPAKIVPKLQEAFDEIESRLRDGLDVAFITLGDPSLFSTYIYVASEMANRIPGINSVLVPGVSSITSVAASAAVPLADGNETIALIPATYYDADYLTNILNTFDTVMLMKVGEAFPAVLEALERSGTMDRAVCVSKSSQKGERVMVSAKDWKREDMGCFASILVARKERDGLLIGREGRVD